jgi:hypothetical protein
MAVNTKMGGNKPRKLPGMMIMVIGKPKDGAAPDPGSQDEPDDDDMQSPDTSGPPAPGESNFHDQRQLCSNCNYFDSDGQGGVGECKMGVPEADFTISDPDASNCKFWEAQDKRSADSAARTGASVTNPSAVPLPANPNPPAA